MNVDQTEAAAPSGTTLLSALRHEAFPLAALLAILVVALGLRIYGLDWDRGFSYTPHPDERAILMKVQEISPPSLGDLGTLLDADESPWNPRWFPYGSFPLYLLKGVQLIYELGPGAELDDLRLAGRSISVLADLGAVLMVFVVGRRVYGPGVGVLASALVALAVIHIQLSHFFAVDTLLGLLTLAAVYFMYRVAAEGRLRDSALAGALIGLGLATKISLAPILAAFVVAHLMYALSIIKKESASASSFEKRWSSALRGLGAGAVVAVGVVFIVQPYTFLDWSRFYDQVREQSEMVRRIRDYPYTRQYIDTTPYLYQIRQLATWGLGWPLGIVAWAGLLFVSVRGIRIRFALAYLVIGWGLPIAMLLLSGGFLTAIAASGVAVVALLATLPFRSTASRMDVLLLSWVLPYFLIIGAFQVKFLRYLLPITPFLLLFASTMLVALWDKAVESMPGLRPWLIAGFVLLLGSTGSYALSYMTVYSETHTAVRAADWINQNAPKSSLILKEHWEEGLPNLRGYTVRDLPLYEDDTPAKLGRLAGDLAEGDYLVFFSNRLYGTISRLPLRYPITTTYYRLLFEGRLGYELVDVEATYPELLGTGFVDDTFDRPGVPDPVASIGGLESAPLSLNLGFADESFTVYDHPKVLVFQNVEHRDADSIRRTIEGASPSLESSQTAVDAPKIGLMLSPEEAQSQQNGGTWSDIIVVGSWANRFPVLAWLIVIEGLALLALPITLVLFRPLEDRGYLFSKPLGLLITSIAVWLLASAHWMAFSRASISLALLGLTVVSVLIIVRRREELTAFVRDRWPVLLTAETVFLLAFFAFTMIRMANPDLWHPFRGGEKPMDLAYLNAVVRSTYMPPYDPWFGGGYLNYYYFGQFMVAMLIRATGLDPVVAYNLAVPLFFAMTVAGAYTIVYNLAEGTRKRLLASTRDRSCPSAYRPGDESSGAGAREGPVTGHEGRWAWRWSPVLAGIGGGFFVTVLGNLDGAIQIGQGAGRMLSQGLPFGQFDFWRSSRMMPPDPPGHEITEFPFFTFLFADLHAHLMALAFTLLALGLALAIVVGARHRVGRRRLWTQDDVARLVGLGVVVGSLRLINTWDFPTYLLIGVAAVALAEYITHGGLNLGVIVRAGAASLAIFIVGYLVFLPFHLSYEASVTGIESTTNTTLLRQFLAISGLFVFIIGTYFLGEVRSGLRTAWRDMRQRLGLIVEAVSQDDHASPGVGRPQVRVEWVVGLVAAALLIGFAVTAMLSGRGGSTIPFAAALLLVVLVAGFKRLQGTRPDAPHVTFAALLVAASLSIVIGLDIVRIEGDIARMNSVFKFYLQVWVLLALASAYLLWRMAFVGSMVSRRFSWARRAWLVGVVVLIVSASVYPVMGTRVRLRDRFDPAALGLTLDGTKYVQGTVYRDRQGEIDLAADFQGIAWLRDNVEGSPIVLEGVTPAYRWGGRVSIYTGLPTVVGWQWHQEQQRWNYRREVGRRIEDVNRVYRTTDPSEALSIMRKYGVKYVYVGQLEALYYPADGLEKFRSALTNDLRKVFESPLVSIYRVLNEPS